MQKKKKHEKKSGVRKQAKEAKKIEKKEQVEDDRISADEIATQTKVEEGELLGSAEAQKKIEKFASMLRTLSKYKKEYKS